MSDLEAITDASNDKPKNKPLECAYDIHALAPTASELVHKGASE